MASIPETGNNDTTYFVLHQLDIVGRAIDELQVKRGRSFYFHPRDLGRLGWRR